MLVHGRCTIYEDRPIVCRTYDCRIYAAADVTRTGQAIAEQVRRWEFSHLAPEDRERHAAVRAAASVHPGARRVPAPARRRATSPCVSRVLAIAVHESFLEDAPRAIGHRSSDRDKARAVVAANERLFADG